MLTVNHCSRRVRQSVASLLLACTAVATLALPIRAHAQFAGKVSATGQFESNSNVFDLESGFVPPGGESRRSDTDYAYGADLAGTYSWSRQQFYLAASTKEYKYQNFTQLDNDSFNVDAGLLWKLGSALDGKLDVLRSRSMVPFFDLTGSALALSVATVAAETAQIGLKLSPDWRVVGTANTTKTEQPIAGAPELQLTQTTGTAAIQYLGIRGLTSGLTADYSSGNYNGSSGVLSPSYDQTTAAFAATYRLSRSTFDGQVGFSHRASSSRVDDTSGLTGLFDFKEQLTPKTSITVKIDREINNYFLNSGSEIDTNAGLTALWQATFKLAVTLGYTFTYRDFPRQGNDPLGSNRIDRQQFAALGIDYQLQRWLEIKPYANVTTRSSNFIGGDFNQTIVGVSVTVTPYKTK